MANAAKSERQYDSQSDEIPLPPGMNAHWFAREGINVLLNGGVTHAEQLFKKFRYVLFLEMFVLSSLK